jgi:hypothetical protein
VGVKKTDFGDQISATSEQETNRRLTLRGSLDFGAGYSDWARLVLAPFDLQDS